MPRNFTIKSMVERVSPQPGGGFMKTIEVTYVSSRGFVGTVSAPSDAIHSRPQADAVKYVEGLVAEQAQKMDAIIGS